MPLPAINPVTKSSEQIRRSIVRLTSYSGYNTDEKLKEAVGHLRAAHACLPKQLIDKEL